MATGTNPPDYTTPTGVARILAADSYYDPTNGYLIGDDAISALLSLTGTNVKRTAALMLRAVAADETLLGRAIQTADLKISGADTGEGLRKLAADLEAQAMAEEADNFALVFEDDTHWVPEASAMPFLYPPMSLWA